MKEIKEMLYIAIPASVTGIPQSVQTAVTLSISGHLSVTEVAAIGLGNSLISILGNSVGRGFVFALDTYFSQAYGSSNKKNMGIFLQRGLFILFMTLLLILTCLLNIRPLLPLIGQDLTVSEMTVTFALLLVPGLAGFFVFIALTSYLQMQGRTLPSMVISLMGCGLNIASQLLAIKILKFRLDSSAVCQSAVSLATAIMLLGYILITKVYTDTWSGWSVLGLKDLWPLVKIGLYGIANIVMEVIVYEISIFVMGTVSIEQLVAQTILISVSWATIVFNIGLGVAVTARIGNQLGAGNAKGAKFSAKIGFLLGTLSGVTISLFYVTLRNELPKLFSSDPKVIEQTAEAFTYCIILPIFEDTGMMAVGVLKGCGRQVFGAISSISFVLIAIPIGVPLSLLTFMKCGGFWAASTLALVVKLIFLLIVIYRIDWNLEVVKAQERTQIEDACATHAEHDDENHLISESDGDITSAPKFSKHNFIIILTASFVIVLCLAASCLHYFMEMPLVNLRHFFLNVTIV